jgi:hypothetical protein
VLEEGEVFTLPLLQLNDEGKEEEQVEGKDGSPSSQRHREMLLLHLFVVMMGLQEISHHSTHWIWPLLLLLLHLFL